MKEYEIEVGDMIVNKDFVGGQFDAHSMMLITRVGCGSFDVMDKNGKHNHGFSICAYDSRFENGASTLYKAKKQ